MVGGLGGVINSVVVLRLFARWSWVFVTLLFVLGCIVWFVVFGLLGWFWLFVVVWLCGCWIARGVAVGLIVLVLLLVI